MSMHQDVFESLLGPIEDILEKSNILGFEATSVSLLAQSLIWDSFCVVEDIKFNFLIKETSVEKEWKGRVTPGAVLFLESFDLVNNKEKIKIKDLIQQSISNIEAIKKELIKAVKDKKEKTLWSEVSEASDKAENLVEEYWPILYVLMKKRGHEISDIKVDKKDFELSVRCNSFQNAVLFLDTYTQNVNSYISVAPYSDVTNIPLVFLSGGNNRPSLIGNITDFLSGKLNKVDDQIRKQGLSIYQFGNKNIITLSRDNKKTAISGVSHFEKSTSLVPSLKIYYGPPGTGKTDKAKKDHITGKEKNSFCIVQIHPSYGYEDLVEGIKPVTYFNGEIKYQIVDGPVKIMAKKALVESPLVVLCYIKNGIVNLPIGTKARYGLEQVFVSKTPKNEGAWEISLTGDYFEIPAEENAVIALESTFEMLYFWDKSWKSSNEYVLILDEINRGHVATILGELVFALSETSSENPQPVKLQYSGDEFIWPKNLSLIGTMNTADTTTDRIDQAIKRRFEFIAVDPYEDESLWVECVQFDFPEKNGQIIVEELRLHLKDDIDLLPWNLLRNVNSCLYNQERSSHSPTDKTRDARDFGAIAVKEKRIGHSYLIKYAKRFLEEMQKKPNELSAKDVAFDLLAPIFKKEIYPSMLNIFNNNEEKFSEFKDKVLFDRKELKVLKEIHEIDKNVLSLDDAKIKKSKNKKETPAEQSNAKAVVNK